ncbi:hypothetical protein TrVFT333_003639 [Trichoderma virens FT-333]|nr:hypothetical protein TrVFT333_003639 [Trichoderma virens FT-333]
MESDANTRYRSRIIREIKASSDNPFNSPPSSTGRASPTLSSVFSDPEGESTRRLQEDIARVAAPRKLPINWEAARRKWPEFYSQPKARPIFDDQTDTTAPLADPPHLNNKDTPAKSVPLPAYIDDTTEDAWNGSKRTRSEMQPRVDEADLSQVISRPPARGLSTYGLSYSAPHNPSPLSKIHNQSPPPLKDQEKVRQTSVEEALEILRRASSNPREREEDRRVPSLDSNMSSAKSSLTAVPPSPPPPIAHSSLMTDSDLARRDNFLTSTFRFGGSIIKDGAPIIVRHGRPHDQKVRPFGVPHAEVDGIKVAEEEAAIFASADIIRAAQDQYEKVQDYARSLQQKVEMLEARLASRKGTDGALAGFNVNTNANASEKKALEAEVASLQRRLDQATNQISTFHMENDTLTQERDRGIGRLQKACENISKLAQQLKEKEKELENTHKQLGSSEQVRQDNDTLRRDVAALKHDNASLGAEIAALRREQQHLRQEAESSNGLTEYRTLRANNKSLMDENEDLRESLDGTQHELDAAREEIEALQREVQSLKRERATLREDNAGLVRHNEKYFSENKILRRENAGFEHSVHDLHERNLKLKEEIEVLKRQLERYRGPSNSKSDFTRQEAETEENMTSAFFVPDITLKTNDTETKDVPGPGSKSSVRSSPSKNAGTAQKVAFALPDKAASKSTVANQGSKRRSVSRLSVPDLDPFGDEDTTGLMSVDNITQDLAISLNLNTDHKDGTMGKETKLSRSHSIGKSGPKIVHIDSKLKRTTMDSADRDGCPALSNNARQILDGLSQHNCQDCTVCSRITSHSGVISSIDLAAGKKRVSIPRPIPVTLALVIKGLKDESQHIQLELTKLQARYNKCDKSMERHKRETLAAAIRKLLDRVEAKNNQIYSLYDVLEGQKAAGQEMTQEQVEMTVLNITGMHVREVTNMSDQMTEGIAA